MKVLQRLTQFQDGDQKQFPIFNIGIVGKLGAGRIVIF
jgi:hypothetical protein